MQNNHSYQAFSESHFYLQFPKMLKSPGESIKILMVGDVIGRYGRRMLKRVLTKLKHHIDIDFVSINGENLAGGFGITEKIYHEVMECGVDVITQGNHWKDKPDIHRLRKQFNNIVLPQNLIGVSGVEQIPSFYLKKHNKQVHVINLMGNFAMKEEYGNPFAFLAHHKESFSHLIHSRGHILIADIHAEASSEKQAMAWMCDGLVSCLIGTHTHTPTSDERLTDLGTAFLSDVGMTGPYGSVIGMNKEKIIKRLTVPGTKMPNEVADEDLWFCGFLVEVDPLLCTSISCARLQCRLGQEEQWLVSFQKRVDFSK